MGNQPGLPLGKVNAFMTATANVVVLILLFRSHQPLWLKVGVAGGEAVGLAFIFGVFIGERRRWVSGRREIDLLRRELDRALALGAPESAYARRQDAA